MRWSTGPRSGALLDGKGRARSWFGKTPKINTLAVEFEGSDADAAQHRGGIELRSSMADDDEEATSAAAEDGPPPQYTSVRAASKRAMAASAKTTASSKMTTPLVHQGGVISSEQQSDWFYLDAPAAAGASR